ncbi:hypothetical protein IAU59_005077 [Kwoniella sp. CBS 9459]
MTFSYNPTSSSSSDYTSRSNVPLPASQTKHLSHLSHSLPKHPEIHLPLRQISSSSSSSSTWTSSSSSSSTSSGGTTLWLSAQILSLYLSTISPSPAAPSGPVSSSIQSSTHSTTVPSTSSTADGPSSLKSKPSPTTSAVRGTTTPTAPAPSRNVLELGGGIGYTALTLASAGWNVTTTDIEPVLSSVLRPNVENGRRVLMSHGLPVGGREGGGDVRARGLDWFEMSELWRKPMRSSSESSPGSALTVSRNSTAECRQSEDPEKRSDGVVPPAPASASMGQTGSDGRECRENGVSRLHPNDDNEVDDRSEDSSFHNNGDAHDDNGREPSHLDWVLDTKWDMIIMTDTFYAPQLVDPLWETLLLLSHSHSHSHSHKRSSPSNSEGRDQRSGTGKLSRGVEDEDGDAATKSTSALPAIAAASVTPTPTQTSTPTPVTIYIALERRDPRLITQALERGKSLGFDLRKINKSRLSKEVGKKYGWADEDWDGVEIWKCRFKG